MPAPTTNPYSSLPLHDLYLPPVPGFWPPAPGWWLVAALLIILVGLLLLLLHRRKRLAYRRQALKELARLEQQPLGNSELLRALSRLLRRAALCAWPDNSGAGLTGQAWLEFLDARGKTTDFTTGAGQCLASGPYQPEPQFDRPPLFNLCRSWLRRLPPQHQLRRSA